MNEKLIPGRTGAVEALGEMASPQHRRRGPLQCSASDSCVNGSTSRMSLRANAVTGKRGGRSASELLSIFLLALCFGCVATGFPQ